MHTLISIVNYRTPELTVACLESLAPEVRANPGSTVIVVDNDSGDRSVEIIGQAIKAKGFEPWCRLVAAPSNGGFAYGNNLALRTYRESSGDGPRPTPDYMWLLNPDTIVVPGALTRLLSFMSEQDEAGIAGGLSINEDGTRRSGGFRFPGILSEAGEALSLGRIAMPLLAPVSRLLERHAVKLPAADAPVKVDWVDGSSFLIRGEVLDAIGGLDEGYFLYWEEADFCLRAARAGFACWHVPDSRVVHIGAQSTGLDWRRRRPDYWLASRARFFQKRYGRWKWHATNLAWPAFAPLGWMASRVRGRRLLWPRLHWWDILRFSYGWRPKTRNHPRLDS